MRRLPFWMNAEWGHASCGPNDGTSPKRRPRGHPSPRHAQVHFVQVPASQRPKDRLESLEVLIPGPQRGEGDGGRHGLRNLGGAFRRTEPTQPVGRGAMDHLWRVGAGLPGHNHFGLVPVHDRELGRRRRKGCQAGIVVACQGVVGVVPNPTKGPGVSGLGLSHEGVPRLPVTLQGLMHRQRPDRPHGQEGVLGHALVPKQACVLVPFKEHIQVRQRPGVRRRRHGGKVGCPNPTRQLPSRGPRPCAGG